MGAEHAAGASGKQQTVLRPSDSDSPQASECAAVGADLKPHPAQESQAASGRAQSLEQSYRGAIYRGGPHDASNNRILES